MALTRRRLLGLLPLAALPGCSSLTNTDIELAIENRSRADQQVRAWVYSPGEDRGEPVEDRDLPRGSRVIVPDVAPAPATGTTDLAVDIVAESYEVSEVVTVTGPGTIAAMLTSDGIDIEFGERD